MHLEPFSHHLKLPDPWQHSAVNHLRAGSDVIVCAPTGAGKTFVFELLVQAAPPKRQFVYTVPTRALANDKYAEWKEAGWKVGLATGDISENVLAPILVATLETQLERLIRNEGPELLVIDEFQMIADGSRGPHYEAAILLAPEKTKLLLLSGSVENPNDVADWMRRINRKVAVVQTGERPVPLDEMPIDTLQHRTRGIEGYWPQLAASALMADLAPLLIFAPRRKDAESIAIKLAAHLPQGDPLSLTQEQRSLAGKDFAALLERRIAYHHSGLGYALRAGLVEPLAKAGQLRVIVSTMGLAAGINFSVRSVHVSSTTFHDGVAEQQLTPDELLQMYGRAGRRGLDERGYVLTTRESPTLSDGRATKLRRCSKLSWPLFIRVMRRAALDGREPFAAASDFALRLFAKAPPIIGLEKNEDIGTGGNTAQAMFGLKGTRHELLNSKGSWEEMHANKKASVPLSEAWHANERFRGPALADATFIRGLAAGHGLLFKLKHSDEFQLYGKEIALGSICWNPAFGLSGDDQPKGRTPTNSEKITPTKALRKLLRIPREIEHLTPALIQEKALPKLAAHFAGAHFITLAERDGLLWARYDFSPILVDAVQDSLARWIASPQERVVERTVESQIRVSAEDTAHAPRSGTPVHAWRTLGLIESNGAPTQRGVIFSFFQHGEGLIIAAALEDESYSVEDIVIHLANVRSACRFDFPDAVGSERLAANCRATYGFVNHNGYMEAGLPIGYGAGTAELLGLTGGQTRAPDIDVAEGDLTRAYIEWLSLLRHIVHAPEHEWTRWNALKKESAKIVEQHSSASNALLHRKLPPLTPKQRHERPKHYLMRK